jgi:hypothetical protein
LAEATHVSKEEYGQTRSYEKGTILDGSNPAAHDDDDVE